MIKQLYGQDSLAVTHKMTRKLYSQLTKVLFLVLDQASDLEFVQVLDGRGEVLQNEGVLDLLVEDLDAEFVTLPVLGCLDHIGYGGKEHSEKLLYQCL